MIEVIAYANFILRIPSVEHYKDKVKETLFNTNQNDIIVQEISEISDPQKNIKNGAIESTVYSKLLLNLPETDDKKRVDEYTTEIIPFLQRNLPNCNKISGIKIVQMKRILDDPNIQERSIRFD